jgi:hypothetical protein
MINWKRLANRRSKRNKIRRKRDDFMILMAEKAWLKTPKIVVPKK